MKLIDIIRSVIERAYITNPGTDIGALQTTQIISMKLPLECEVIYPYGTHGNPPEESLGITFAILANDDNRVGIFYSPNHRPRKRKPGEFVTGNFVVGSIIEFNENGDIIITGKNDEKITVTKNFEIIAGEDVNITCKTATITAETKAIIDSPLVEIAGGGPAVARVGDSVSGGVITSGSAKVTCG